jgi:uncharacterized protein (DUF58 family)
VTRPPALVPTVRAAVLIALAAPVALLIAAVAPGAWVAVPVLGLAVIFLVAADGWLAGRLLDARVIVPADAEVGGEARLVVLADLTAHHGGRVDAALALDPRLAPGGAVSLALAGSAAGAFEGIAALSPTRRGTGRVERLWLRWTGPLGLGARQSTRDLDAEVRVWPNLAPVRSPALQVFLRNSQFGVIARRIRGEGTEFEALAEYQPGMDRRRIDWKSSARHSHLYAKEYEVERNNQIVFAFDCGQAMCEPVGGPAGSDGAGTPRIDRAISAALTTAYVALKGGDRVALFGFAARPELATPFISDAREFHRLQSAAAGLDYHAQEPNFTLALATLAGRLQRRSLIVVFSDFTDPTSAELMIESIGRLVSRHLVIFVTMVDQELDEIAAAPPDGMEALAMAVTADSLLRQRALVTGRLRQLGVDVIEAPHGRIGTRLIDSYLEIKRKGAIG